MTTLELVVNAGNLFSSDAIEQLADPKLYDEDTLRIMFEHMCEHFDRHQEHLNDDATAEQVGFFFLSRVMHILGFTHSHNEPLPNEVGKVDYTLFESPDEFLAHVSGRGTSQIFSGAIAIGKAVAWGKSLDGENPDDTSPENPAFDLDDGLRQTSLQWAILSNGHHWRLFHRNTTAMLNTFFEVDVLSIIKNADFDTFKVFVGAFSQRALSTDKSGSSFARRLLA